MQNINLNHLKPESHIDLDFPSKLVWTSLKAKNTWQEKLEQIQRMVALTSIESVRKGLRNCVVLHQPSHAAPPRGLIERKTTLDISRQKGRTISVWIRENDSETNSLFSNNACISLERLFCLEGYPECCAIHSEQLITNRTLEWERLGYKGAFIFPSRDNESPSIKGHFACNPFLAPLGIQLLPFCPCGINCSASIALAMMYCELLVNINRSLAMELFSLLEMPLRMESLFGISTTYSPIFMFVSPSKFKLDKGYVEFAVEFPKYLDLSSLDGAAKGTTYPYSLLGDKVKT